MTSSTSNARIAELEAALKDCIGYLRALPPNPMTYRVAAKAEDVLLSDDQISDSLTYGEVTLQIKGNKPVTFQAQLDGAQRQLNVKMDGVIDVNGAQFCAALRLGMQFDLAPDDRRTQNYFASNENIGSMNRFENITIG